MSTIASIVTIIKMIGNSVHLPYYNPWMIMTGEGNNLTTMIQ